MLIDDLKKTQQQLFQNVKNIAEFDMRLTDMEAQVKAIFTLMFKDVSESQLEEMGIVLGESPSQAEKREIKKVTDPLKGRKGESK